jgi:hypothetical protein
MLGVAAVLWLAAAADAAAPARLEWVVKDGKDVDKSHAERIYFAACRWMEEQMDPSEGPIRPKLTVHVGEACPREQIEGACMNPARGQLYLPEWDEEAPHAVAQATLATALYHLLDEEERRASGMQVAYISGAHSQTPVR